MRIIVRSILFLLLSLVSVLTFSQASDSIYDKLHQVPDQFFNRIDAKSEKLQSKILNATEKYLNKLEKQERKMQKELAKKDSAAAAQVFGNIEQKYSALHAQLKGETNIGDGFRKVYSGNIDSIKTALSFFTENKLLSNTEQIGKVLESYKGLQGKLNQSDNIRRYLQQRQVYLKEQLQKLGLTKQFKKFQEDVYYYRAQVDEYKKALEDPSLMERKLFDIANHIPTFKNFFAKYSDLGRLFLLPGANQVDPTGNVANGLQTRSMLQQMIQDRFGSGPNVSQMVQQNVQGAQSQLSQLKNKLEQLKSSDEIENIPGFKPNSQKTKSFWDRIEFGTNLQTGRSSSFFPVTSDLGLSVGYKLNGKSIVGLGASYKMGWGQNIRNLKITQEGVGFRSFLDWKVKGSFYGSGGFEYNYQKSFSSMQALYVFDDWQESGLLGVSKIVSLNSKFFKKTKVQMLWDFLSYRQRPAGQPIKFRVGYNL
jgi:hypothetical protein